MGPLSYLLAWAPVAIVLGVVVLLSTYVALLALLLAAGLALAVVGAFAAGVRLFGLLKRAWQRLSNEAVRPKALSEHRRETAQL